MRLDHEMTPGFSEITNNGMTHVEYLRHRLDKAEDVIAKQGKKIFNLKLAIAGLLVLSLILFLFGMMIP